MNVYFERMLEYLDCSNSCYICGFALLDRFSQKNPELSMDCLSCQQLIMLSMLASIKFNEDITYLNTYYAKIAGLTLQDFNKLEKKYIDLMNWNVEINEEEFRRIEDRLIRRA